jgi:hypothetical protein
MMASLKLILVVVWNPAGFRAVDLLPKGVRFCSACYLSHIMDPLLAALQPDQKHPLQRVVIYADNAHVHASKIADEYLESHRVLHADHPLYSPDLALSDFLLFEFIKG